MNLVFAIACVIKLWSHETYDLFLRTVRAKIMKTRGWPYSVRLPVEDSCAPRGFCP